MYQTQKEKAIIAYLSDGGKSKDQIVHRFRRWPSVGAVSLTVGQVLDEMVEDRFIELLDGKYKVLEQQEAEKSNNQLSIF